MQLASRAVPLIRCMGDLRDILNLWRQAKTRQEEVCLVTVVGVEGPSYRKPGARMLLTQSGLRAGTISGGCLEAEVQKKAWWLTRNGPAIETYSTFFDDDSDMPYGLGCGGTVTVLLERGAAVDAVLAALADGAQRNEGVAIVLAMETRGGIALGTQVVLTCRGAVQLANVTQELALAAEHALARRQSFTMESPRCLVEYAAPSQRLFIFGAGDDAQPLTHFAVALGWRVTVVDGRAHLATPQRFPAASSATVLPSGNAPAFADLGIGAEDAVVLMTHSFAQDCAALPLLLAAGPRYLGVLGPRQRTLKLLEVATGSTATAQSVMEKIHSPVGMDLSCEGPAEIALSIVAEIQAVVRGKTAREIQEMVAALRG